MRHVSRTHRFALAWLFDRINLDPKIQIKHIDTKSQLADILTKGNITRDDWNHLLCLFYQLFWSDVEKNAKRFRSKKRSQQNRSRWWIWSRDAAKGLLTCLPLLHQKARGKPDLKVNTSEPMEWAASKNRESCQGRLLIKLVRVECWQALVMEVRTGRPVYPVYEQSPGSVTEHTDKFIVDNDDIDSDTVEESDMSLISRSFLHTVNDRVRKIQDQSSKDATHDSKKHSLIWWRFMSATLEASVFMGKNYLENFTFHQKYRKRSHNETDVWHIWKVDSRTIRWHLWTEYN